jgi:dolichol-phosphate mannosyltransferase
MDCDLQDPPEAILELYAMAQRGYDIVVARRQDRRDSILKRVQAWLFYKVFSALSGMDYDGRVANFRILSRKVVREMGRMREQLRFFGGMIEWLGYPVGCIDVPHGERYEGKSTYTLVKLVRLAAGFVVAYSERPLTLSVLVGFGMAGVAFVFGIGIFLRALLYGIPVQGWASVITSLYFLGGLTLATLGTLGVYVGKIFQQVKGRPLYVLDRDLRAHSMIRRQVAAPPVGALSWTPPRVGAEVRREVAK